MARLQRQYIHYCGAMGNTRVCSADAAIAFRIMGMTFLGGVGIVFDADGIAQLVEQFFGFLGNGFGQRRLRF